MAADAAAAAARPRRSTSAAWATATRTTAAPARLGGGILFVDGIIYASSPSNVYAIDARDGTLLWHYYWKTRGGTSLQTRGLGMWRNYIYFELHDDWVVCLDAKTGKEIWKHEIAPFDQQYFSSNAPMVIGDHVLVGTGNDLDAPAFLKSLDPRTGAVQWILYSTPQNPGRSRASTPGPSLDAARHGNGATWIPGSYDPETNLYIYGTGNPTPAYTQGRGEGDNLFTSCAARGERRYRQDGVVLPDLAARHARLGLDADADPRRHAVQRPDAQAGDDRDAQRLLLRARSHQRRAPADQQARPRQQLGDRPRREGTAEAQSATRTRPSPGRS